jgi:hypothetical protein
MSEDEAQLSPLSSTTDLVRSDDALCTVSNDLVESAASTEHGRIRMFVLLRHIDCSSLVWRDESLPSKSRSETFYTKTFVLQGHDR